MRSVSYRINGVTSQSQDAIRCQLEAIPAVEKVELSLSEDRGECVVALRLKSELAEQENALSMIDEAVAQALAPQGFEVCLPGTPLAETYVTAPLPKEGKKISLGAAIGGMITVMILAVLVTFGVTTLTYQNLASGAVEPEDTSSMDAVELVDRLFDKLSPIEADKDALLEAVLKAYVASSGDKYAEYFNDEEHEDFMAEQKGEMSGIGVTVVNGHVKVGDEEWQAILVANVYADSPAEAGGVKPGDAIVYIGKDPDKISVNEAGYTKALELLRGAVGTTAEFTVYRPVDDEVEPYEILSFSIERKKISTRSVTAIKCTTNEKVGIVRITGFDDTTAPQFAEAITSLQAEGCESFVFDLRGNPGGGLSSVIDVLTYFLNEDDVILSTKDKYGKEEFMRVGKVNEKGYVQSGTYTLKEEDVGRFRDLSFVVLVNEYSASAAELFTANIRDYELGPIVGVTTYGKGTMQTTYDLGQYGYSGALKLTTRYYYPPSGESYDGEGIVPDVEVVMSAEAASYNINLLPHDKDNQLQQAISLLYE